MKLELNKNRTIVAIIVFIIAFIYLVLNKSLFLLDNTFQASYFMASIILTILFCILVAVKIDFNKIPNRIFNLLCPIFSTFYLFYIIELLNQNNMFSINFMSFLFNIILISLIYLLFLCISNNLKFSLIFSNVILFLIGFANYAVSTVRGTPLSILDILGLNTGIKMLSSFTINIHYYLVLAIASIAFLIALNSKIKCKFKISRKNIIIRITSIVLIIIIFCLLVCTNFIEKFKLTTDLWLPNREYKMNGFLGSFFKQGHDLIIKQPEGYSLEKIEEFYSFVQDSNQTSESLETPKERKPNIIVIMSESFSDLRVHRDFETNIEFIPYFKELSENYTSGNIHASTIGGRTPNSEWEFLTNNTLAMFPYGTIPFQQFISKPTNSLVNILEAQGYTTYGSHPWISTGYRRDSVYPLLGFDHSFFIEDIEDQFIYIRDYPSDLSTYEQIIKLYEEKDENENFFNYTLTMQNHGSYDFSNFTNTVHITNIDDCDKTNQYLTLLKKSDDALKYLIDYFSKVEEDTIILFMGDHQPPDLDTNFIEYINKGKNMNCLDHIEKDYIVPFVLWSNFESPKIEVNDISFNYLSILLLDAAGLNTTPYMDFLRMMQKEIPVITSHGYIDRYNKYHSLDQNNRYLKTINNYFILQYNNMFDKNFVNKMFEIK